MGCQSGKNRAAAAQLADVSDATAGVTLERLREQLGATDIVLWSGSGQLIASAGQSRFQLVPERPSASQLRAVRTQRAVAAIEGLEDTTAGSTARSCASRSRLAACASSGASSGRLAASCSSTSAARSRLAAAGSTGRR